MTSKITFSDLVEYIAVDTGASGQKIHALLKEMVAVIREGLQRDGRVSMTGLGTFSLRWRTARQGRNPQTGEPIEIPAHNRVYFNPDANLRRFINRKYEHVKASTTIPKSKDSFIREKRSTLRWTTVLLLFLLFILVGYFSLFRASFEPAYRWAKTTKSEGINKAIQPEKGLTGKKKQQYPVPENDLLVASTSPAKEETKSEADVKEGLSDEKIPGGEEQKHSMPPLKAKSVESLPDVEVTERKKQEYASLKPDVLVASTGMPGRFHDIRRGDRLWTISEFFYISPYLWPNIFRVNVDVIEDPDVLEVGTTIHVPPLEGKVGNLSQRDMMNIVEGYIRVYLAYRRLGKLNAPYYLWVAKQYNVLGILDLYLDKIDQSDLHFISRIKGSVQIR